VKREKTRPVLVRQNLAAPPLKSGLLHARRSEIVKVVEMSPMACDVWKIPETVPLLVETRFPLAPESCPAVMVKISACVQSVTVSPPSARNWEAVD